MSELLNRAKNNVVVLRQKREKLFKAFDIYKSNIEYGLITETDEVHQRISSWYLLALDLDYNAITNYPPELDRYL